MTAPVEAPVIGIALTPLPVAFSLVGLIVRIRCQFLLLPEVFPSPLAEFFTAIALILHAGIGLKKSTTVGASNPGVHGFPPTGNHKPLKYFEKDKRKDKNQNQGKKKDFENAKAGTTNWLHLTGHGGHFFTVPD
jgi:hypothetical protein